MASKKLPKVYRQLTRIKVPTLIIVKATHRFDTNRTRILYPDGRCLFRFDLAFKNRIWSRGEKANYYFSCFLPFPSKTLKDTVLKMYRYDKISSGGNGSGKLNIEAIIPLM